MASNIVHKPDICPGTNNRKTTTEGQRPVTMNVTY